MQKEPGGIPVLLLFVEDGDECVPTEIKATSDGCLMGIDEGIDAIQTVRVGCANEPSRWYRAEAAVKKMALGIQACVFTLASSWAMVSGLVRAVRSSTKIFSGECAGGFDLVQLRIEIICECVIHCDLLSLCP